MLARAIVGSLFAVALAGVAACAPDLPSDSPDYEVEPGGAQPKAGTSTGENEIAAANGTACEAASTWLNSCGKTPSTCDAKIVETCADVTKLLNASIVEGARTCLAGKCDVSPAKCFARAVTSATSTDAHKKLAEAFCGCLPTGETECVQAIAAQDGPSKVALTIALPLSDDIANAITEKCTTTPGCSATFSACAQAIVTAKVAEKLPVEAAGCVAKSVLSAAKDAANGGDPSCTAKTCEDYEGKCGEHDNGCGGKLNCGECAPACTPKTCAELGKTCGTHADGCGGTVNCGACAAPSCADKYESNNTAATATMLGSATDAPNTTKSLGSLTMSDGDEDWFKLRVTDAGFGGNPTIDASVGNAGLEVSVFHVCDAQPDYSSCTSTGSADNTVGRGCRGVGSVSLTTDCKGFTETGTTYVRVRKRASDGICKSYSVFVNVY